MIEWRRQRFGIYGGSKAEAIYPTYFIDNAKRPLSGANEYRLRFAPVELPPVNAFWSLTLNELSTSLLYANPLNRYLISPMLPSLKRDADGSITLYVKHARSNTDKKANWPPAAGGAFFVAIRVYWPKPAALHGKWKAPPLDRVDATSGL